MRDKFLLHVRSAYPASLLLFRTVPHLGETFRYRLPVHFYLIP